MTAAAPPREPSWVGQLSLILTVTAAVVISLRLLVVATWSRRTALAILQSTGTGQVATGVLVSTIGTAGGAAVGFFLVVRGFLLSATHRKPEASDWTVAVVAVVLEVMVVPTYLVPITGAVLLLALGTARLLARRPKVRARLLALPSQVARWVATVGMAAAVLLIVLIDNRPWLPPENLTLAPNGTAVTGYVLNLDDHDLTLLVGNRPRNVLHIIDPEITRREICGGTSIWWDVAPYKNLLGLTTYPPCVGPY